ncbi:MAG: hypothetical protein IPM56_12630 [Ignavibacteriales bacterium]|nr:MAG: hypothetical protein IPM56_12630 [Ignavibacteriales bacterium]
MDRSLLVAIICALIFSTTETVATENECKYFLSDSTTAHREESVLNTEPEKNYFKRKSFLILLEDIRKENQIVISRSQKSAWLAFGLSVLYPGLGQVYNGEYGKAFLMAGLATLGLAAFYYGASSTDFDGKSDNDAAGTIALTGVIIGGVVYLWSLIDAPVSANQINRKLEGNLNSGFPGYDTRINKERLIVKINFRLEL